jgi:hypothetical protein
VASVVIDIVAIVALLVATLDPIAATGGLAVVIAAITVDVVAVLARFTAGLHTVTASGGLAVVITAITIGVVAVVTSLGTGLHTVATAGRLAVVIAAITIGVVAVITVFTTLGHAVAAHVGLDALPGEAHTVVASSAIVLRLAGRTTLLVGVAVLNAVAREAVVAVDIGLAEMCRQLFLATR